MTPQELDRLIDSLTEEELQQLRDRLPDEVDTDPVSAANRKYVKSLFGGGND